MGRRKIEIQPITHERNRSVTFLKAWHLAYSYLTSTFDLPPVSFHRIRRRQRKNGLFKKAYELGVLCSVDVAVIIFEERPGHHVKLYQYCSSDINNIVQRHLHTWAMATMMTWTMTRTWLPVRTNAREMRS
ncbi:hypothetical protein NLJ89_g12273 [Agrocybe chaxingu]|uniref:MADS-box domain-containing protein n=1 Tax=Agrocybe chaxingu TaxID=84603 RepID=A0A9W8JM64_9AGAR|nr:hypothetical protein NLJ89_g12273 [Agrocybe chaxingu]